MKAIRDGLLYDSEDAILLGTYEGGFGDSDGYLGQEREKYYKTKSGRYFYTRQVRITGVLWGHGPWREPHLSTFTEEYAKRLKLEGKINDPDLVLEKA